MRVQYREGYAGNQTRRTSRKEAGGLISLRPDTWFIDRMDPGMGADTRGAAQWHPVRGDRLYTDRFEDTVIYISIS